MTFTITLDQAKALVTTANRLGQDYVLQAVLDAGYTESKRDNIEQHIDHSHAAMNDILQAILSKTPEVQEQLKALRPLTE